MPIQVQRCCCTGESGDQIKNENFCEGCYPNFKVSPITVKIEKKPRYPPYKAPHIKPVDFDRLFPAGPNSLSALVPGATPCQKCAKLVRAKEIQLIRKDQELQQYQRFLQKHGGRKHDYGAVRELEFKLLKKEQEIAQLQMEAIRRGTTTTYRNPADKLDCAKCALYLRRREQDLLKLEQEVVKQMASPYINMGPNPCSCCSDASRPQANEKYRKKNQKNCLKELNKKEKILLKKEREIDMKIKQFRKEVLEEAKEDMKKTPDSFIKDVYLNCKCACLRHTKEAKSHDPCSYNPYAKAKAFSCHMPFPMWNTALSPDMHSCTTKCCVMRLIGSLAKCYLCPATCNKKKDTSQDTCIPMRLLKWWAFRGKKRRRCD